MQKSMFSIVFILLGTYSLFAQKTLSIEGFVIAANDNTELIGASIFLTESEYGTFTDIDGTFKLTSDYPLPWKVNVKYLGYLDQEYTIENMEDIHLIKIEEDPRANAKVMICPLPPIRKITFRKIKGRVIDKTNKTPLIATKISIEGSQISTITNFDGYFDLDIPHHFSVETLTFSYTGYKTQKLPVKHFSDDLVIELEEPKLDCRILPPPNSKKQKKENSAKKY